MPSAFAVILEDFEDELTAVGALVSASADPNTARPKTRIAGANAAVLLLAATFEEFVREMARAYARAIVEACDSYEKLPHKLATVLWKRTMEALARLQLSPRKEIFSRESIFSDALTRFTVTYQFCRGDISQDIYEDLIHNENNMRPQEINSLFNLSGLKNVCMVASDNDGLMELLNETEPTKANARLVDRMDEFYERRNQIAHSIRAMRSSGPQEISGDIEMMRRFGQALCLALEKQLEVAPPLNKAGA